MDDRVWSRDCTSKYWNHKYVFHTTKLETTHNYSWCISNPICDSRSSTSFSPPEEYIGYLLLEAALFLTLICLKLVQPPSCVNTLKHIYIHTQTYMNPWSTRSGMHQSFKFVKKRRWIANKSKANALVNISACWYSEGTPTTQMSPWWTSSRKKWWRTSKCFEFEFDTGFCESCTAS